MCSARQRHAGIQLRRLDHDVGDQFESRRQPVAMLGPSRRHAEQARDAVVRDLDAVAARIDGDQTRVPAQIVVRRIGRRFDLGLHLEVQLELGVLGEEHVVPLRRADDHHVEVERHRYRLRRAGQRRRIRAIELLDANLAVAQARLSGTPTAAGSRTSASARRIRHAAVRAVQRAGANQRYVGIESAARQLPILDESEQILVRRIVFADDRRMRLPAAVDQQVDRVAPSRRARYAARRRRLRVATSSLMVFDQIASQPIDPLRSVGQTNGTDRAAPPTSLLWRAPPRRD